MKKFTIALIILFMIVIVQPVFAHPADYYFHNIKIELAPEYMLITWEITPGPLLTQNIWAETDQNHDQIVTTDEAFQEVLSIFASEIHVFIDSRPLTFEIQSVEWPNYSDFTTGNIPIRVHLQASWPNDSPIPGQILIKNEFKEQTSLTLFSISAENGMAFQSVEQSGATLQFLLVTPDNEDAQAIWESGKPAIPKAVEALGLGDVAQKAANQSPNQQGINAILEGLVRSNETSPSFILAALAIAFIVGILHALTPGHGKTIVAAYLVGSRGTFKHAIVLGSTVTLTHTGSVFLIGLVTLVASQYILPTNLLPVLEIVSGVLILALGFNLLIQRVRSWQKRTESQSHYGSDHHHTQDHDHGHTHSHEHNHDIPALSDVTWRSLLALGISGGLVPCPEAIAILLLAISINRILLGLSLIFSFSFGLAAILIAIGITMVQSKQLFARLGFLDRWGTIIPVISALIVLGLGLVLTVGAIQNVKVSLKQAQALKNQPNTEFDIQTAGIIYLAPDSKQRDQIFVYKDGKIDQLTHESQSVRDYSLSLDSAKLVYSVAEKKGGTSLWLLDPRIGKRQRVLACPKATCWQEVWSIDTSQILYSRLDFTQSENPLGVPSIWWLDLANGQTKPVFGDAQLPVVSYSWSPDGKWLAYTSLLSYNIELRNLQTGQSTSISRNMNGQVVWDANSVSFLYLDNISSTQQILPRIFRYDLINPQPMALTNESPYNEYSPTWSPDSKWIAFIRQEFVNGKPEFNDQLWLMHADGSNAAPITDDEDTLHGQPVWSPDGKYLLFGYYPSSETLSKIKILDIQTSSTIEIANGKFPAWLP